MRHILALLMLAAVLCSCSKTRSVSLPTAELTLATGDGPKNEATVEEYVGKTAVQEMLSVECEEILQQSREIFSEVERLAKKQASASEVEQAELRSEMERLKKRVDQLSERSQDALTRAKALVGELQWSPRSQPEGFMELSPYRPNSVELFMGPYNEDDRGPYNEDDRLLNFKRLNIYVPSDWPHDE